MFLHWVTEAREEERDYLLGKESMPTFSKSVHDFCVIGWFYLTKHKLLLACKLWPLLSLIILKLSILHFSCALIVTLKELFFDGILYEASLLKQVKTCALKHGVCILINTETQWINLCTALRGTSWYVWKSVHLQGIEAQQWTGACGCAWKLKSVLYTCVFPYVWTEKCLNISGN